MDPLQLSPSDVEKLPEGQALEVLASHVKAKKKELVEALVGSKSKALARAAKKALYQLKSSGVEIQAPAPIAAPSRAPEQPVEFPGLLSAVLGNGERAIIVARAVRGGGVEIFQALLHDELGLEQLDWAETSRSTYRKHLRVVHQERAMIEVPLARALSELGRALAQNDRAKTPVNPAAHENLRKLRVTADPSLLDVAEPEGGDEVLIEQSATLHDQPEIGSWLPPEAQIAALAQLVGENTDPAVGLQSARKLAEELFVGSVRPLYARRLAQMAEFFAGTGRELPAKIAGATARRLFHDSKSIGGFELRLFEKVIALTAKKPS
jgi:hypothetical protein